MQICVIYWFLIYDQEVWQNIYFVHMQEYFRVFPRKQILILNLETHSKNMKSSMEKVYAFLEVGTYNRYRIAQSPGVNQKIIWPNIGFCFVNT